MHVLLCRLAETRMICGDWEGYYVTSTARYFGGRAPRRSMPFMEIIHSGELEA